MSASQPARVAKDPVAQLRRLKIAAAGLSVTLLTLATVCVVLWKNSASAEVLPAPAAEKKRTIQAEAAPRAELSAQAAFVKRDDKRGGAWKNDLGKEGYVVFNRKAPGSHETKLPGFIQSITCNGGHNVWAQDKDPRGLEDAAGGDTRLSACEYAGGDMLINIQAKRPASYDLALYCLDQDRQGRSQRVDVLSGETVLCGIDADNMGEGAWLHFRVRGSVDVRVTNTGQSNGVVSGIFIDNSDDSKLPRRMPPSAAADDEAALKPGLIGEFFDGLKTFAPVADVPTFSVITPELTFGTLQQNGLRKWPLADGCAATFSGFLRVEKEETYTFFLQSDDGSNLYIDAELLVNNDGSHGLEEKSGVKKLTPGLHRIWIEYFNSGGSMGLNVFAKTTSKQKAPINPAQLFHNPQEVTQ
jgi:hypothetical protein